MPVVVVLRACASATGSILAFGLFILFGFLDITLGSTDSFSLLALPILLFGSMIVIPMAKILISQGTILGKALEVHILKYISTIWAVIFLMLVIPIRNLIFSEKENIIKISDISWDLFIIGVVLFFLLVLIASKRESKNLN